MMSIFSDYYRENIFCVENNTNIAQKKENKLSDRVSRVLELYFIVCMFLCCKMTFCVLDKILVERRSFSFERMVYY